MKIQFHDSLLNVTLLLKLTTCTQSFLYLRLVKKCTVYVHTYCTTIFKISENDSASLHSNINYKQFHKCLIILSSGNLGIL